MNFEEYHYSENRPGVLRLLAFSLIIVSVSVFLIASCKSRNAAPALNFAPVPDAQPQNSYADVVSKVAPAVITIRADKRVRTPQQFPFFDDPFFRGLFGDRAPQQPRESLERSL